MQVAAVAAEDGVWTDVDFHVQITRRAAVLAGLALAGEPDAIAVVHAGGNLHGKIARLLPAAAAAAFFAGFTDHGARATTLRAGLLDRKKALLHAYLAHAGAGVAGARLRAGLGPGALA